ncbi:MAG: hypothetical protein ACK5OX_09740 [Desertimonas sp.]
MNLFRSEETVFQWSQTRPDEGGGLVSVEQIAALFAGPTFRRRLDPDYFARFAEYRGEMGAVMVEQGMTGPAFMPPRRPAAPKPPDWHD